MCYDYKYGDDDIQVTMGANWASQWGGVIQKVDGNGTGYNTKFILPGDANGALYHIHFKLGSTQVLTIRYFPSGSKQGDNVIVKKGDCKGLTIKGLCNYVTKFYPNCPNYIQFLTNLNLAVLTLNIGKNNQYDG